MEVDIEMVVDEKDDEVRNENDFVILEGNDINDELAPSDGVDYEWLIVIMRVTIRLTPTHMKIIFNQCNVRCFFISHLFLNTSFHMCLFFYS
jgi:hypothetical protein